MPQNSDLWFETYRPNTLKKVLGSATNINNIKEWANEFYAGGKPHFPAVLLSGPPGTGKTSTAIALAKDYGWSVTEFNASDTRTYDELMKKVAPICMVSGLQGGVQRRLILLDEIDNLHTDSGKFDKSAVKAIQIILQKTKHPVVFTCNTLFDVPKDIQDSCILVKFQRMREGTIRKVLLKIAKKEKLNLTVDDINNCISKGDLRSSINNLQLYSADPSAKLTFKPQTRHSKFEMVEKIFRCQDTKNLNSILLNTDITPDNAILWIAENVTLFYKGLETVRAFDQLSKADKYLHLAKTTQDYHYWSLATHHMTVGVALARIRPITTDHKQVQYPTYLRKLSATKRQRKIIWAKGGLAKKLAGYFHMSAHSMMQNTFPLVQKLCLDDPKLLLELKLLLKLNEPELAMILDTVENDPRIKRLMSPDFIMSSESEAIVNRQKSKEMSLMKFFR